MLINVSVIGFIALSAYWFGFKEGFFSGVVHLACAIASGAIAFAFWEPFAFVMLSTGFGEFAWGVSMLSLYCFSLIGLKIATNLAIPERQNFPPTIDSIGGLTVGALAGVIGAGVCLIGVGFLPVGSKLGGTLGQLRTDNGRGQPAAASAIIPPVHTWMEKFYGGLSTGAFRPIVNPQTLAKDYPDIAGQSWSLHRDTDALGRVELTVAPDDVEIGDPYLGPVPGQPGEYYIVPVKFMKGSYHRGDRLVVSSSQVKLVGYPTAGQTPEIAFPLLWRQGRSPIYKFDDVSHYITNTAGEQTVDTLIAFPKGDLGGQPPKTLMLKGTRFPLAAVTTDGGALASETTSGSDLIDSSAPMVPAPYIKLANDLLGVEFSKNTKPSGITLDSERAVVAGEGDVPSQATGIINKSLKVNELYEPDGTKIVRVNISRGKSPIDVWGDKSDARNTEGTSAPLLLVDSTGQTYQARGYLHKRELARLLSIFLDTTEGVKNLSEIPSLSTAGKDQLELIFVVPEGRKIIGLKLGETTIARFDFTAARNR